MPQSRNHSPFYKTTPAPTAALSLLLLSQLMVYKFNTESFAFPMCDQKLLFWTVSLAFPKLTVWNNCLLYQKNW